MGAGGLEGVISLHQKRVKLSGVQGRPAEFMGELERRGGKVKGREGRGSTCTGWLSLLPFSSL